MARIPLGREEDCDDPDRDRGEPGEDANPQAIGKLQFEFDPRSEAAGGRRRSARGRPQRVTATA